MIHLLRNASHSWKPQFRCSSVLACLDGLGPRSSSDQLLLYSEKFVNVFKNSHGEEKRRVLAELGSNFGANRAALDHAIALYSKNEWLYAEVRSAATPTYFRLLQSVGNLPGGVKLVCGIRAYLLGALKKELDKETILALRHIELACRELLTAWFCLSNLKLERLTWESPGDILQKVAEYEAVHPVRGLSDFRKRLGPLRRCFYFQHEALPREPLVMVHVALLDHIASSVQRIMQSGEQLSVDREEDQTTAIYYSITSTQPGLSGIDLGNMLIKRVALQLQHDVRSIKVHSTLSPIPGFRAWLIRNLYGNSEYDSIVNEKVVDVVSKLAKKKVDRDGATKLLLQVVTNEKATIDQVNDIKEVLMYACAHYLCGAKRNGSAINAVANFHCRNGAEVFRLNWMGDTSYRGINSSFGMMVNYRYDLAHVHENSAAYTQNKVMAVHENVRNLMQ